MRTLAIMALTLTLACCTGDRIKQGMNSPQEQSARASSRSPNEIKASIHRCICRAVPRHDSRISAGAFWLGRLSQTPATAENESRGLAGGKD
jgi:hypothetical protein